MSAAFTNVHVELQGAVLHTGCELTNGSAETWSGEGGWACGYHLFDESTGTLVVDGERSPLDLGPGQSQAFHFDIALPPEPGEYSIYIAPVRENVAWMYADGWPFLLIDIAVDERGLAALSGCRVTNRRAVSRQRIRRTLGRAFTLPALAIWRNRGLIRTLVRRDVMSRYSGSFGGAFWAVLNPLLLMLTYFLVFGVILNSRFPGDPSRSGFALYYLAGFLPWLAFSEAVGRAPFTMVEHRGFIKKLVFPVEILPINLVASGMVTEFFGVILFGAALLILRGHLSATSLYLPLLLLPQILFTTGLCWFLSALGVFVRDLAQINGFVITIWFFVTPICYPESALAALPPAARGLMTKNPVYILVRGYRSIFLESRAPDWAPLAWLTFASALVFLLGHAWFYKLRKSFADLI